MKATMQDVPLNVSALFEHGRTVHPDSVVVHYDDTTVTERTFDAVGDDVVRLANALRDIGVGPGDVVATLCWNTPAHLAAYFAVPSIGAVLHTLNLRLHRDQLGYIVEHAGDRVIIVDSTLVDTLAAVGELGRLSGVEHVIVVGTATPRLPAAIRVHRYADLLDAASAEIEWPVVDETTAAALCYTSGTTGNPKGVAYSHRSMYLHTLQISTGSAFGFSDADRVFPIVPMFHANAWGWPHAAWVAGSDIVLGDRHLRVDHLARVITELRPTATAAVPTLWTGLDTYARENVVDYSSLRLAVSGGSPLSASLVRKLADHGVTLTQGWGMTETSPLLTFSRSEPGTSPEDAVTRQAMTGHIVPGVRARVVGDDGAELPWDGESVGEIQLRGATITGGYVGSDGADAFDDGWLRTGDLGVIARGGWIAIKDRLKDGIKSGGEWISTVELEAALSEHPDVAEVAVFGVADPKWEERPLACVVAKPGAVLDQNELVAFLSERVARWWLPERWAFLPEIPKTTVGKMDKRQLRSWHEDGTIEV
ncbi:fatty acid--CoA ligase [Gordonia sp. TBRC 11910]|uniref:Fatty acid--CoA ligase n=1 Tax=Gordonia asplenii TaxID=2725283 RepID=A0A848L221_9ACTN|nr:fatty acid--CoA ligase [Gordonia asplenii]NMO02653.1 fatty acid--CoA ligase [Gordonia asplenii]